MMNGSMIPVLGGKSREPPTYGMEYSENASRTFFASRRVYTKYLEEANKIGELRRELLRLKQIIRR